MFLHGLMGYGNNWRKIASGLQQTDQVLTYDQRGHGKSMKPATGYAPEDFADDLFLITQELGWEKFVLVGHSMGGRNAMNFAFRFPQKLEKLVIEDIGPEGDSSAPAKYRRLLGMVPTPFSTKLHAKEFFLNEFKPLAAAEGFKNLDTLGMYLYSNLIDVTDGGIDWRFSKDAILSAVIQGRAKDRWNELEGLTVSTLLIRGSDSDELSHETYERILKCNPLIKGVEIANAGHWVHYEQAEQFLQSIREFVGE